MIFRRETVNGAEIVPTRERNRLTMSVENRKQNEEQGQEKRAGQENRGADNKQGQQNPGQQSMQNQGQANRGQQGGQGQDRMMSDRWGEAPHTREIRDAVSEAGTRLRSAAEHAMPAAREQWERVQHNMAGQAESLEESLSNYVRERPINSLLIAAGVGLAFGLFFFRR